MGERNDAAVHAFEIAVQVGKVPGTRALIYQVNSGNMDFTSFQGPDRGAAPHQVRHEIVVSSLLEAFGREKHRRVTSRDNNIAAQSLAILKELNLHMLGVGSGSENQTVSGCRERGKLSEASQRTH